MSTTVIATVNLANPEGGPSLPAGVPVEVDDTNQTIRDYINSGYLVPVTLQQGQAGPPPSPQNWTPGDPNQPVITDASQNVLSGGQAPPAVTDGSDSAPDTTGTGGYTIQERKAQDTPVTELARDQARTESAESPPRRRGRS